MVKLRSGKIYIDQKSFNYKIQNINYLIKKKYLYTYQNELEDFYFEIRKLNQEIQLKEGAKGGKYFENNGIKIYINGSNKNFLNNNYFRLHLYENLWIKISEFLIYYKKLIKKKYIKNGNLFCLICYSIIKKGEKLNVCNSNNKKHIFHNSCFKESLKYSSPYHFINSDILKNCPYCNQKTMDERDIYIAC